MDLPGGNSETREDVLHVPSLFDFFCERTAADMRSRGGTSEPHATSFAGIIATLLFAFAFYVIGQKQLAKASFVFFGLMMAWMVWGAVIRSSQQVTQKADNIKAGLFPAAAAPFVLARLKWWNHLVVPLRWGKHSRLFDRRTKLERKIEETQRRVTEAVGRAGVAAADYRPPDDAEAADLANKIHTFSDRSSYESEMGAIGNEVVRLRAELVLYQALLYKLNEMSEKLDRIEKLTVTFQNVSPDDLSQVVAEAIQLLEERRILVLNVDTIDPEDFIDLVTVRVAG